MNIIWNEYYYLAADGCMDPWVFPFTFPVRERGLTYGHPQYGQYNVSAYLLVQCQQPTLRMLIATHNYKSYNIMCCREENEI